MDEMMQQSDLDGLLTTRQAAEKANKHPRTIVAWIRRGLLPAKKLPGNRGQYLISPEALDSLLHKLYTPETYIPKKGSK
jgi:excisionase family DNA binding protein